MRSCIMYVVCVVGESVSVCSAECTVECWIKLLFWFCYSSSLLLFALAVCVTDGRMAIFCIRSYCARMHIDTYDVLVRLLWHCWVLTYSWLLEFSSLLLHIIYKYINLTLVYCEKKDIECALCVESYMARSPIVTTRQSHLSIDTAELQIVRLLPCPLHARHATLCTMQGQTRWAHASEYKYCNIWFSVQRYILHATRLHFMMIVAGYYTLNMIIWQEVCMRRILVMCSDIRSTLHVIFFSSFRCLLLLTLLFWRHGAMGYIVSQTYLPSARSGMPISRYILAHIECYMNIFHSFYYRSSFTRPLFYGNINIYIENKLDIKLIPMTNINADTLKEVHSKEMSSAFLCLACIFTLMRCPFSTQRRYEAHTANTYSSNTRVDNSCIPDVRHQRQISIKTTKLQIMNISESSIKYLPCLRRYHSDEYKYLHGIGRPWHCRNECAQVA